MGVLDHCRRGKKGREKGNAKYRGEGRPVRENKWETGREQGKGEKAGKGQAREWDNCREAVVSNTGGGKGEHQTKNSQSQSFHY